MWKRIQEWMGRAWQHLMADPYAEHRMKRYENLYQWFKAQPQGPWRQAYVAFLHRQINKGEGDIDIEDVKRETERLIETHGRQHAPAIQAVLEGMNTYYYEETPKGDPNRLTVLPKHWESLDQARTALRHLEGAEKKRERKTGPNKAD